MSTGESIPGCEDELRRSNRSNSIDSSLATGQSTENISRLVLTWLFFKMRSVGWSEFSKVVPKDNKRTYHIMWLIVQPEDYFGVTPEPPCKFAPE